MWDRTGTGRGSYVSVEAIAWALKQPIKQSSAKFVLVVMAHCADKVNFLAWPSTAHLVEATGQDRKTVLKNVNVLREMGFITDTGERKGDTRQIPVYRLNSAETGTVSIKEEPVEEEATGPHYGADRHYLYRLTDPKTGQFYVGVRLCVGEPTDDRYMGSGRWPQACKTAGVALIKEILGEYEDRVSAMRAEQSLIDSELDNPLCMNSPKTGTGCAVKGKTVPVPNFPSNGTVFTAEQSQISLPTVPKTGHGKVRTVKEPSRNQYNSLSDLIERGVSEQVAEDWLSLRKKKKAEVTKTAVDGIQREATKAGIDLDTALQTCCARGWTGFNATWMQDRSSQAANGKFDPVAYVNRNRFAGAK